MEYIYIKTSNFSLSQAQIKDNIEKVESYAFEAIAKISSFKKLVEPRMHEDKYKNTFQKLSKLHNMIFIYYTQYMNALSAMLDDYDEMNNMDIMIQTS